jgi:hypothetical protein
MGKLFSRLTLRVIAVWVLVACAVFLTHSSTQRLIDNAATVQVEADGQIWDIVHELSDNSTSRAVIDYTFWDDMVAFAEGTLDADWAHSNLDPSIESFGIDALWVLDPDGTLRYSVMKQGDVLIAGPPLPFENKAAIDALLAKPDEDYGFIHEFYWFSPAGPMSIFGSGVTVTDDPDHTQPNRGYYFVGVRLTSDSSLKALEHIGATTEAVRPTAIPPDQRPTASTPHVFYHPMTDFTGALAGAIRIERTSEAFSILAKNSLRDQLFRIALWVLVGLSTSGLLISLSRTRHRAAALAADMTNKLREANTLLEQRVSERTAELKTDIAQREAAEAALLKRTAELERMNKVMMDREMRILELKKQAKDSPESGPAT